MINHTEILFTIAETKVLTLHLYVKIIVNPVVRWLRYLLFFRKICVKNAKCVKYCADKYEFSSVRHDENERWRVREREVYERASASTSAQKKCKTEREHDRKLSLQMKASTFTRRQMHLGH
jgi:hypothetical protein